MDKNENCNLSFKSLSYCFWNSHLTHWTKKIPQKNPSTGSPYQKRRSARHKVKTFSSQWHEERIFEHSASTSDRRPRRIPTTLIWSVASWWRRREVLLGSHLAELTTRTIAFNSNRRKKLKSNRNENSSRNSTKKSIISSKMKSFSNFLNFFLLCYSTGLNFHCIHRQFAVFMLLTRDYLSFEIQFT